ncbi:pilus assembly protein [Massilia forsythiae]|uniref:Pilus assembly protein n=1 Tax=Massilia forsythiae TaxID=2728020 RepID=A0A7Z2VVT4_9BURK|nr:TadE family protein [Massilia forsythiae]QJD99826.1 pilus assembly protein [Massilia forsythiae]
MKKIRLKIKIRQAGVAAVEFSIVVAIFLMIVFATLELARVQYLLNTLMEVTRRAAAMAADANFKDPAVLQTIQADAVFRSSAGALALGTPVTSANVTIDYLSISKTTLDFQHITSLPSCPARNRWICMNDQNADNCIRFVRARICASMDNTGNCQPVSYQKIFPFLDFSNWKIPIAETIVPAGSLGHIVGSMPCP